MEANEKKILSTENQVNKAEKILKGEENAKRVWFQKRIDRQLIKGSFSNFHLIFTDCKLLAERMLGVHSEVGKRSKKKMHQEQKADSNNVRVPRLSRH